jgi:hypothetical protein
VRGLRLLRAAVKWFALPKRDSCSTFRDRIRNACSSRAPSESKVDHADGEIQDPNAGTVHLHACLRILFAAENGNSRDGAAKPAMTSSTMRAGSGESIGSNG